MKDPSIPPPTAPTVAQQLAQEHPSLTNEIKTASTATNVMDMPTFETPDATLLLKRKQRGLVNGATQ